MTTNRLLVHIGLPKAGSTSLQKTVLPILSKRQIIYNDAKLSLQCAENYYKSKFNFCNEYKFDLIERQDNGIPSFISSETLIGANAINHQYCATKASEFLPRDSEIIIILRKPKDWLRSYYTHFVAKNYFVPEPTDFFLDENRYSSFKHNFGNYNDHAFAIDSLDFEGLVQTWRALYNKVTVIPLSLLFSRDFFNAIDLEISDSVHNRILKHTRKRDNKSFNKTSLKLSRIRYKILREYFHYPSSASMHDQLLTEYYRTQLDYSFGLTQDEYMFFIKYLELTIREYPKNQDDLRTDKWFGFLTAKWRSFLLHFQDRFPDQGSYSFPDDMYLGKYYADNLRYYNNLEKEGYIIYDN